MESDAQSRVELLRKRLGIERKRSFSASRHESVFTSRPQSPEVLSPLTCSRRLTLSDPVSPPAQDKPPKPFSPSLNGLNKGGLSTSYRSFRDETTPMINSTPNVILPKKHESDAINGSGLSKHGRDSIRRSVQLLEHSRSRVNDSQREIGSIKSHDMGSHWNTLEPKPESSIRRPPTAQSPGGPAWDKKVRDYARTYRQIVPPPEIRRTPDVLALHGNNIPSPFIRTSPSPIGGRLGTGQIPRFDAPNDPPPLKGSVENYSKDMQIQINSLKNEVDDRSKRWKNLLSDLMSQVNILSEQVTYQNDSNDLANEASMQLKMRFKKFDQSTQHY